MVEFPLILEMQQVYGFITLNKGILLNIVDHPLFQRLSRIKQLGLTYLVYPGAHHTRFHHAIGAAHLMGQAIHTLQENGFSISKEEVPSNINIKFSIATLVAPFDTFSLIIF